MVVGNHLDSHNWISGYAMFLEVNNRLLIFPWHGSLALIDHLQDGAAQL